MYIYAYVYIHIYIYIYKCLWLLLKGFGAETRVVGVGLLPLGEAEKDRAVLDISTSISVQLSPRSGLGWGTAIGVSNSQQPKYRPQIVGLVF